MDRRVVDLDLGFTEAITNILGLEAPFVRIGIQEGSVTHQQTMRGRTQRAGVSIAEYAAQNEFGTNTIPQRSFMRTAFDENIDRIDDFVEQQLGLVVDRRQTPARAFGMIGQFVQGLVQIKIRKIRNPPNSPATIARKGSSKPLIDFGQMIASVRYVVGRRQINP